MSDPQQPLDYQHPPQRQRPRHAVAQCIATAMLMAAIVVGATFGFFIFAFGVSEGGGGGGGTVGTVGVILVLAVLGLPNFLAYRAYRSPDRRHLALGIWIGLGVGLLIEGACFGIAMR